MGDGPEAQKLAKMTQLSMLNSISFCGALRFAPWKVTFYERGPCLVAFLIVAQYDLLLGGPHCRGK